MGRYDDFYPPYRPVAQQRSDAAKLVEKLRKKYPNLQPVVVEGRTIAKSFWGKAWCDNVETYMDHDNRLPRGRAYVRNGAVVDVHIFKGVVHALVSGSQAKPYKVEIHIDPLTAAKWKRIQEMSRGKVDSLLSLMQGKLPESLLHLLCDPQDGIFPRQREIHMHCKCPDGARLCKHLAAVLYGIGHRLDEHPELFFTMRSIEVEELFGLCAVEELTKAAPSELPEGTDLSAVFGIALDSLPESPAPAAPANKAKRLNKKSHSATSPPTPVSPIHLQDTDLLPALLAMVGPVFATRSALACAAGVSAPSITNWENGKKMTPRMQERVRAFLQGQLAFPIVRKALADALGK